MRSLLQESLEREIRHDKLVMELSKHTGKGGADSQDVARLADKLEPFLGSILDALDVAMKFAKDPQCGRAVAFASAQVLQYCFDEEDLFPERDYGVLGLLDDAYLVHRFVGMLLQMYPHVNVSSMSYRFSDEITLQLVRTLLPAGVCDALDRTCYNLIQVASALFTSGVRESSSPLESVATLRIDEAISILSKEANV